MKKQSFRMLITIVLVAISIVAVMVGATHANEENKVKVLKSSDGEYLVYIEDMLSTDFLFAFDKNADVNEEELIYSAAGEDLNKNKVAYITSSKAEALTESTVYMWVKVGEEVKVAGREVKLSNAMTETELELINTSTHRISVVTTEETKEETAADGVVRTYTQGKIEIKEEGNDFSYSMVKVSTEEQKEFLELIKQLSDNKSNIIGKIELIEKFESTYSEMIKNAKWEKVENNQIAEPQDSVTGDVYIVLLKDNTKNVEDIQILECKQEQKQEVEPAKKITITETVKLPITFDTVITWIIVLVVLVALTITLIIVKNKKNSKQK